MRNIVGVFNHTDALSYFVQMVQFVKSFNQSTERKTTVDIIELKSGAVMISD